MLPRSTAAPISGPGLREEIPAMRVTISPRRANGKKAGASTPYDAFLRWVVPSVITALLRFQPLLDSPDHLHIRSDIGLVFKLGGMPLKSVE